MQPIKHTFSFVTRFSIVAALTLMAGLGVSVFVAQQNQDQRSRASSKTFIGRTLGLTLSLQEVGSGGKSMDLHNNKGKSPVLTKQTVIIDIYDSQGQLVTSQQAVVTYNTASGKYKGRVVLHDPLMGVYTLKIKTNNHMYAIVSGVHITPDDTTDPEVIEGEPDQASDPTQPISEQQSEEQPAVDAGQPVEEQPVDAGQPVDEQPVDAGQPVEEQPIQIPEVTLMIGDINGDKAVDVADLNILMGCYSDLLPAVDCTPENKLRSDLNEDGDVNQIDYNVLLREMQ
jgi:hypothetical protein